MARTFFSCSVILCKNALSDMFFQANYLFEEKKYLFLEKNFVFGENVLKEKKGT